MKYKETLLGLHSENNPYSRETCGPTDRSRCLRDMYPGAWYEALTAPQVPSLILEVWMLEALANRSFKNLELDCRQKKAANVDFAVSLPKARLHRTGLNHRVRLKEKEGMGLNRQGARRENYAVLKVGEELCHDMQRERILSLQDCQQVERPDSFECSGRLLATVVRTFDLDCRSCR